jgi:hypothetical protein
MFTAIAGAYPSETPFRRSTAGTTNIKTRLERFAGIKHSTLVQKFVTYDRKKFYNIDPSYGKFIDIRFVNFSVKESANLHEGLFIDKKYASIYIKLVKLELC